MRHGSAELRVAHTRRFVRTRQGLRALLLAGSVLLGCNSYDGQLITSATLSAASCGNGQLDPFETCDERIASGQPGACPRRCERGTEACEPNLLVGEACQRQCVVVPIVRPHNGDKCCPASADATSDSDCGSCGDGILGPNETCDPPETCPREETCKSDMRCVSTLYSGSPATCNAVCELSQRARCGAEDGCCPSNCGHDRDGDCSTTCGDGTVDMAAGELCETKGEDVCPADCDDEDPCTVDMMVGRPSDCNVACVHTAITQRRNGDGCCPPRTSILLDRDCGRCGNGRMEGAEECDGGEGCNPDCTLRMARAALVHRYDFEGTGTSVRDRVGEADGSVINARLEGDGELRLSPAGDAYVELPSGLVSDRASASFEVWLTWHGDRSRRFERIFDFGDGKDGESGASSLFLSPNFDESGGARLHYQAGSDVARLTPSRSLPVDWRTQVVAVFDSRQRSMRLYIDGQSVGGADWPHALTDLPDVNNWLGRSQYYERDPGLWATLHEFRIYEGVLSASAIAASYENGPDTPR